MILGQDPLSPPISLAHFVDTALGKSLLSQERNTLAPWLKRIFGYHALLVGNPAWGACLQDNPIQHRLWLKFGLLDEHPSLEETVSTTDLSPFVGDRQQWPLLSDGIDLVYLAHGLEQEAQPHQLLREAHRVLIPQGHVLISTFNPWSLFGLCKPLLGWYYPDSFWAQAWINRLRLKDWLALLGFTVLDVKTCAYQWPWQSPAAATGPNRLEAWSQACLPYFGNSLLILAQKNIYPLTPIKPAWLSFKDKQKLAAASGLEPSVNQGS